MITSSLLSFWRGRGYKKRKHEILKKCKRYLVLSLWEKDF
jgi:hypothetical protein